MVKMAKKSKARNVRVLTIFHTFVAGAAGWDPAPERVAFDEDVMLLGFTGGNCAMCATAGEVGISRIAETPASVAGAEGLIASDSHGASGVGPNLGLWFPPGKYYHLDEDHALYIQYYLAAAATGSWVFKVYYIDAADYKD